MNATLIPPGALGASASPRPAPFLDEAQSMSCIHCGLCLSSCPTYLETGNENLSPRGRIYLMRAVQEGRLSLDGSSVSSMDSCLGCRACEAACPSGVPYGHLLEQTRHHIESHFRRPLLDTLLRRIVIENVFPHPERTELALRLAQWAQRWKLGRFLPRTAREALELLPSASAPADLPPFSPSTSSPPQGRAGFVSGCVMSVMFGPTHANSVRLLNMAGFDVETPATQACCGALHAHGGRLEQARSLARKNITAFESRALDVIVINAAGCGSTLKEYGSLLSQDPLWASRASAFSSKVKDLSEVLDASIPLHSALAQASVKRSAKSRPRVTCHDACHLTHAQRIAHPPRHLIRALAQECFVELPESDVCCGSAGSYNLTEPEMASRLQRRKIQNILHSQADIVVTTNPGCLLQIQAGLNQAGMTRPQVLHLADYLMASLSV